MGRIKNIISKLKLFLLGEHEAKLNDSRNVPLFFDINVISATARKKTNYVISPLKFYLKENFEKQFNKLLVEFETMEIRPKVGLEAEFYVINIEDKNYFFDEIYNFSRKNNIALNRIKDENCKNQFELEFIPYLDLPKLIGDFVSIKEFLITNFQANFEAKPFYYSVGSSLQINISLNDKNGNNLFKKQEDNSESLILLYSVGGLLVKTNEFLDLYMANENCMARYDLDLNRLHQISGNITSPSYNCWGINNRTCSIRIPSSKYFRSPEKYVEDTKKNRRIEYRIPSSDCDIGLTLYGTLYSILYGIRNELYPPEQTNNNVITDNFSYLKYETIG